ncbi:hypothetical protein [Nonomuraea sp. NPDC050786]|uniref:hypothetical protein n=1 Tax=Nonomuraea sp. NPDC050786 TaxID=3154840 RepID=UPI0033C868EC
MRRLRRRPEGRRKLGGRPAPVSRTTPPRAISKLPLGPPEHTVAGRPLMEAPRTRTMALIIV